jgi:hypothetical protein
VKRGLKAHNKPETFRQCEEKQRAKTGTQQTDQTPQAPEKDNRVERNSSKRERMISLH